MLNHDRVMQMVEKKIINNTKSNWYSLKFNFYWFRCWCYPRFEVFFDNEVEYLKLYAIKYIIGHKCMYPWKYQFNSSPRNVLLSQFFVRSPYAYSALTVRSLALSAPLCSRTPLTTRLPCAHFAFTKRSPCFYRSFSVHLSFSPFSFTPKWKDRSLQITAKWEKKTRV